MILKFTLEMKKIKNFLKNKFAVSLISGAVSCFAFAPFNFPPAAIISLSVFYFLLEEESEKKQIFWLGFFYGFGYFLAGIYWISISLLVEAEKFAWLIPFALTLIPSALALYLALFAASYKFLILKLKLSQTYQKILLFSIFWMAFEILRSLLFTGFPWNLIGYVWMFDVRFAQLSSIFGIYGLSVFAVLICLFPTLFLKKNKIAFGDKIFAGILILFFIGNFLFGFFYIDDKKLVTADKTKLRLVQANIKQEMKWDVEEKYKNLLKHIALTNSQSLDDVKAVIWSETSVPYVIENNSELIEKLNFVMPLITGGIRLERDGENIKNVWNSVFVIEKNAVKSFYDKHHLVPFGEYIPLQKFLPFVEKITDGAVGFNEGEGPQTIAASGFSFSPLLCYEIIFTDEIVQKNSRPDLLINLTNDAWFGVSSGPYQHFNMARMRSIEQGIPLARVAGTGITAFVDPFGRVVKKIDLNQEGIIDVDLIKNLAPTIYANYGYQPLMLLLAAMLFFLITTKKIYATRQNHSN
jgi:apolipoprotein N-acyltransferase